MNKIRTRKELTDKDIISLLKKHKDLLKKYKVKRIGLFGSYVLFTSWAGSFTIFKRVCSERVFLRNPQKDVESLWNEMIFPLMEAVSTILPTKWAHITSWES